MENEYIKIDIYITEKMTIEMMEQLEWVNKTALQINSLLKVNFTGTKSTSTTFVVSERS